MKAQLSKRTHKFTTFATDIGFCGIAWGEDGISAFQLPEGSKEKTAARMIERFNGRLVESRPAGYVQQAIGELKRHLSGKTAQLGDIPIDYQGVPLFFAKVYQAAREIPAGKTVSYAALARSVGSPSAARAVGQAMARNPFALLIPCHRVVGGAGRCGGFSAAGGLKLKQKLLSLEGVQLGIASGANQRPAQKKPSQRESRHIEGKEAGNRGTKTAIVSATAEQPATIESNLPFDLKLAVEHIAGCDKSMYALVEKVGEFRLQMDEMLTPFEALAESIVYQQLTGKAAATIFSRVKHIYGDEGLTAAGIVKTADEKLRAAGLSGAKTLALKDLASKQMGGLVPSLAQLNSMTDEEIIECLTTIRGIGRWTVEMLLIFRLGRPDVLPVNDLGVRKGFALTYQHGESLPTPGQLASWGERWRPYRSVASWYLWRALDKG